MIEKNAPDHENAPDRGKGRDRKNDQGREIERNRKNHVEDRDLAPRDENARAQGRDRQVYREGETDGNINSIYTIVGFYQNSVSISLLQVNR